MTAEIAIMNRQGIALAADSAVTVGGKKVYKTSSKLFSLGPCNDIAIMIFGNGQFSGHHWDTVIKLFRKETATRKFSTVAECSEAFINHLNDDRYGVDRETENINHGYLIHPIELIKQSVDNSLKQREFAKEAIIASEGWRETFQSMGEIPSNTMAKLAFLQATGEVIDTFAEELFERNLSGPLKRSIRETVYVFLSHKCPTPYSSGVVVAGFGDDELFPAVCQNTVDGKTPLALRAWRVKTHDPKMPGVPKTLIMPFAQSDIFKLFMEGISPEQISFLDAALNRILNDKSVDLIRNHVPDPAATRVEIAKQRRENKLILEKFGQEFSDYRRKSVVAPILDVVEHLPKEDLADMAQAMVELTGLRRKVDSPIETVGGPVDVAIISKGDGLVWKQRKLYFDGNANSDFVRRKYVHLLGGLE